MGWEKKKKKKRSADFLGASGRERVGFSQRLSWCSRPSATRTNGSGGTRKEKLILVDGHARVKALGKWSTRRRHFDPRVGGTSPRRASTPREPLNKNQGPVQTNEWHRKSTKVAKATKEGTPAPALEIDKPRGSYARIKAV